jgi:hypothetical protein
MADATRGPRGVRLKQSKPASRTEASGGFQAIRLAEPRNYKTKPISAISVIVFFFMPCPLELPGRRR